MAERDYEQVVAALGALDGLTRAARMERVVDVLWEQLAPTGVSWVGFYWPVASAFPDGTPGMELGPRRDKPACSPIGLHGACGQAYQTGRALVVADVAELGAGYIACDPRDRSEVVVPLLEADGSCWAVLDVDSHAYAAFRDVDAAGLGVVLAAAGLTQRS